MNVIEFPDARGRRWHAIVQWNHPVPAERGVRALRFVCLDDPAEPVRLGYAWEDELADPVALRQALDEADPARPLD